ncbi:phosphatase PAP2 family protein [Kibdelosporangium philippinense]|uniref:Phosphatase PAP2 family protein n=1 Tax=Kibdelosporangium philippinense TaxID=211113 RepID=A0ABS8ZA36_9PSEU|nr:phosphatase PAP2 family protein [Kibdelosporangium philippinense]MCE7003670.1 phosphatase PAP2 family protein [Kibdelosporangium philippinense]
MRLPVAVLLAVATSVTYVVMVGTAGGQLLDYEMLSWFDPTFTRASGEVPLPLTVPAPALFVGTLIVVCVIGLGRRVIRRTVVAVVLMVVAAALAQLLKVGLARPDLAQQIPYTDNSFPSGHVTVAAICVFAVLLVVPGRAQWFVAVPGFVWVGAVGISTLVAGWHRPSDFLGAVLLAASCYATATAFVVERADHRHSPAGQRHAQGHRVGADHGGGYTA